MTSKEYTIALDLQVSLISIYSTVPLQRGQFSQKYSQKTPHGSSVRARYGLFFVNQHRIDIMPEFLQSFIPYRIMLDRVTTALDCIDIHTG